MSGGSSSLWTTRSPDYELCTSARVGHRVRVPCKFCLVYSCASASTWTAARRARPTSGSRGGATPASRAGTCRRRPPSPPPASAPAAGARTARARARAAARPRRRRRPSPRGAARSCTRRRRCRRRGRCTPPPCGCRRLQARDAAHARAPPIGSVLRKVAREFAKRDAPRPSAARAVEHRALVLALGTTRQRLGRGRRRRRRRRRLPLQRLEQSRSSASSAAVSAVASSKVVCIWRWYVGTVA